MCMVCEGPLSDNLFSSQVSLGQSAVISTTRDSLLSANEVSYYETLSLYPSFSLKIVFCHGELEQRNDCAHQSVLCVSQLITQWISLTKAFLVLPHWR